MYWFVLPSFFSVAFSLRNTGTELSSYQKIIYIRLHNQTYKTIIFPHRKTLFFSRRNLFSIKFIANISPQNKCIWNGIFSQRLNQVANFFSKSEKMEMKVTKKWFSFSDSKQQPIRPIRILDIMAKSDFQKNIQDGIRGTSEHINYIVLLMIVYMVRVDNVALHFGHTSLFLFHNAFLLISFLMVTKIPNPTDNTLLYIDITIKSMCVCVCVCDEQMQTQK